MVDLTHYRGRKVLITGAGGFVGSHLTEACARLGATVTAMTHYNSSGSRGMLERADREVLDAVSVQAGDIQDSDFVSSVMAGKDVVFHLAAQPLVRLSYDEPVATYATNVMGTVHLLEAARHARDGVLAWYPWLIGIAGVSFLAGLIMLAIMMTWLRRRTFAPFAVYRMLIGALILALVWQL